MATITGTAGNDTLTGDIGDDLIKAGFGDDVVYALPGNDTVNGGNGNDWLAGGGGNDAITGGIGNDTLKGGMGTNTLVGGTEDDYYVVKNATDVVTELSGEGTDRIGSHVTFTLSAEVENMTLLGVGDIGGTGNALNNTMDGNTGNNTLIGDDGDDKLKGFLGNDDLDGGNGNDTLVGNKGNDTIDGGADNDFIKGGAGDDSLIGGSGIDTLVGRLGDDIYGVDDVGDVVTEAAGEGTDTVQASIDYTLGAELENLAFNGVGSFVGTGNAGDNQITGGASADTLDGATGRDTLRGGDGDDTYMVDDVLEVIVEFANQGTDTIVSTVTFDLDVNIENLTLSGSGDIDAAGNSADNDVIGNSGDNELFGLAGDDFLDGGAGNDSLNGGADDDTLTGGVGNDTLTGNIGNDRFFFNTALNAATNVDVITDFGGSDQIGLENAIFAAIGAAGALNADFFHIGLSAADGDDFIVYDDTTGQLFYDPDGNGVGAQVLFADLDTAPTLDSTDFLVT